MNKKFNFLLSSLFLLSTAASLYSSELNIDLESMRKMCMRFLTEETTNKIIKELSEAKLKTKEELDKAIMKHRDSDPIFKEKRKGLYSGSRETYKAAQQEAISDLLSYLHEESINASLIPVYQYETIPCEETEFQRKPLSEKEMSKRLSAIENEEKSLRQTTNQEYYKHLKDIKRFHSKFEERQLQKKEEVRLLQLKEVSSRDELIKSDDKFFQDMQQRFATEKNKIKQKEQSQKAKSKQSVQPTQSKTQSSAVCDIDPINDLVIDSLDKDPIKESN